MLCKWFKVPIYGVTCWLVIVDDVAELAKVCPQWEGMFGTVAEDEEFVGLCFSAKSNFGLLFRQSDLSVDAVSHEVFHLTRRILEWTESNFDTEHHEQGAMLHGWLMKKVFALLTEQAAV